MQYLINGLIAGATYALVALSFSLIFISARFFHFAHGAIFTGAAYCAYFCSVDFHLPLWVSWGTALVVSALLGVLCEVGLYRPLRRRGASSFVLLLSSFGLYVVLQNLISLGFGDETRSLGGDNAVQGIEIRGAYATPVQISLILVTGVLFAAVGILLRCTAFGKHLRAVADDGELARVYGIDVDRVLVVTFGLGSALAAVAALFVALDVDMAPTMGLNALVMGIVAMVVGGVRSTIGALLGGLLLSALQQWSVWQVGAELQNAITFAVLIGFLLLRPQGVLGGWDNGETA